MSFYILILICNETTRDTSPVRNPILERFWFAFFFLAKSCLSRMSHHDNIHHMRIFRNTNPLYGGSTSHWGRVIYGHLVFPLWGHEMETPPALLALCVCVYGCIGGGGGGGVALMFSELWCFLWCCLKQAIKQTIDLPMTWDAIMLIWRPRNALAVHSMFGSNPLVLTYCELYPDEQISSKFDVFGALMFSLMLSQTSY